jgi:hypothetical protein
MCRDLAAIFWVITQRVVVIPYRRFGTTYRCHHEDGTDKSSRNFGKEYTIRCVITHKNAVLIRPYVECVCGLGIRVSCGTVLAPSGHV